MSKVWEIIDRIIIRWFPYLCDENYEQPITITHEEWAEEMTR